MTASPGTPMVVVVVGGLALIVVRGILLWILLPVSTVVWILGSPWFLARGVSLWRFLGWVDLNFVAALQRSLFRPFFKQPIPFVRGRDMRTVTHRVRWLDLA